MKFAVKVWKLLVAIKDGLVLIAMLVFFGLLYGALSASPYKDSAREGALRLDLAGAIVDELRDAGVRPIGVEGKASARWVLLDYGHFVVHVQHAEDREFYALDRLWKDSPAIDLGLEGHGSPASAEEPEPEFPAEHREA